MKTLDHIPTGKIERASKLVTTGVKLGGNYIKYIGDKIVDPDNAREKLDEENAKDIYDGLKSLKGSALKVAQMLSMEKNLCPRLMLNVLVWHSFPFHHSRVLWFVRLLKNISGIIPKTFSIRLPLSL